MYQLQSLPLGAAKSVAFAILQNADRFGDEFLVSERRARQSLFSGSVRRSMSAEFKGFLAACILQSKTDIVAADLYRLMTRDREKNMRSKTTST